MNNLPKFSKEKKRILCVEDHKDTCDLIAFLLSDYEIVFTDSIDNSLEIFKQGNFDLCILDNWLTDGLGTELCRQFAKSIRKFRLFLLREWRINWKLIKLLKLAPKPI